MRHPCSNPPASRYRRAGIGCIAAAGLALTATPAAAGTVELVVVQPLDFGAMVVLGAARKQITPDGRITASGLAAVPGAREGAAEFILRYRPDSPGRSALLLVTLATASPLTVNGSTGTLTGLATDLPGLLGLTNGQSRTLRLTPCAALLCETRIRVGGTLTLSGGSTAASFSFPLQVTARLLAEL
ncbi:DUF4402 domain-containing protein [Novosphingobium piscinae]|uniref:DUF4402 domain-containing protein n=1 Tax=Novosphingobium piscinae TaxID=1507448 RepID=A0A7X1KNY4_9SPHN|nr:DUF4402 domain-containing protein [Novosphingobium piscinae]MBC2668171.1 DUF4402 domain-containing protein [Novosphingobium piscinae]